MWLRRRLERVFVQVDGALGANGDGVGLGVVVRDERGRVLEAWRRRIGRQTNNEAEYQALIWALELLGGKRLREVHVFSDSEVMVNQMRGQFAVNSPALKRLHRRACGLARGFPRVTYTHIPRDLNRLADALAAEALWRTVPWEVGNG